MVLRSLDGVDDTEGGLPTLNFISCQLRPYLHHDTILKVSNHAYGLPISIAILELAQVSMTVLCSLLQSVYW